MGSTEFSKGGIDFKLLFSPYLRNWKWFVICAIAAIFLAFLYLRYATPKYAIRAKIQILDDESTSSEIDVFQDLQMFTGKGGQILDEIEVLGSRSNMIRMVKELGLNKKIIALGNVRDSDVYVDPPFKINFLAADSVVHGSKEEFQITLASDTTFEYALEADSPVKVFSFGKRFSSPVGDIIITPNVLNLKSYKGKKYKVAMAPLAEVAEIYQKDIMISVADENSNIISISLNEAIKARGRDIINTLVENYNQNAVDDKKAIADRTSSFINDRIADIYGDLSTVDQSAEDFKSGRGIADITTQTNVNVNIGAANHQELQNASVQLDIASSMKDIVENEQGYELLPANVGLADASIAATTARYNELALERKRLLESSNEKNPIIVNLDQQLDGLKRSMRSSLNSMTNNLGLQVNSLSGQLSRINSRIYSAPKNERALRDITRQQETTESLYLYLLQKREESQITFASASPKSKIIDNAYAVSEEPVSPKTPVVLMASLILGFLVPFSVIYSKDLLDNKVHNKVSLEKLTGKIPVLAELPKILKKENTLVKTNERTVLAESLRILRTNLDYVLKSKKSSGLDTKGNTIFVTSSVPGEGKTLVASNLAMIYANSNKRVLLIGADIRNPKIYQFYSGKNVDKLGRSVRNTKNLGLTDFLVNEKLEPKDIISPMLAHEQSVDVVYSGRIPPNPAELLMSERIKDLFAYAKGNYDYIIVDTAPVMVVSDTLLISTNADQTLYVTRAGMTELRVIEFPLKMEEEGKLKGLSFIVNGVKDSNLGYGGKYGYGYGKSVKKWWKF
ncbi:GumC family protein [Ulvibacterium marinum]|uniref:non-specific protein-tyrosine kinase n=1 Tax=Ulvibacterium marinum TaxID=2419782 RepID=A0A3B0BXQ8_9FLAO|nr:tyrosine-protein kinase [Ulvibacterium marinum]RKN76959.1 polysaccharide biosynthesis tyrosine autokinase [Ulvibacterium marinum]